MHFLRGHKIPQSLHQILSALSDSNQEHKVEQDAEKPTDEIFHKAQCIHQMKLFHNKNRLRSPLIKERLVDETVGDLDAGATEFEGPSRQKSIEHTDLNQHNSLITKESSSYATRNVEFMLQVWQQSEGINLDSILKEQQKLDKFKKLNALKKSLEMAREGSSKAKWKSNELVRRTQEKIKALEQEIQKKEEQQEDKEEVNETPKAQDVSSNKVADKIAAQKRTSIVQVKKDAQDVLTSMNALLVPPRRPSMMMPPAQHQGHRKSMSFGVPSQAVHSNIALNTMLPIVQESSVDSQKEESSTIPNLSPQIQEPVDTYESSEITLKRQYNNHRIVKFSHLSQSTLKVLHKFSHLQIPTTATTSDPSNPLSNDIVKEISLQDDDIYFELAKKLQSSLGLTEAELEDGDTLLRLALTGESPSQTQTPLLLAASMPLYYLSNGVKSFIPVHLDKRKRQQMYTPSQYAKIMASLTDLEKDQSGDLCRQRSARHQKDDHQQQPFDRRPSFHFVLDDFKQTDTIPLYMQKLGDEHNLMEDKESVLGSDSYESMYDLTDEDKSGGENDGDHGSQSSLSLEAYYWQNLSMMDGLNEEDQSLPLDKQDESKDTLGQLSTGFLGVTPTQKRLSLFERRLSLLHQHRRESLGPNAHLLKPRLTLGELNKQAKEKKETERLNSDKPWFNLLRFCNLSE